MAVRRVRRAAQDLGELLSEPRDDRIDDSSSRSLIRLVRTSFAPRRAERRLRWSDRRGGGESACTPDVGHAPAATSGQGNLRPLTCEDALSGMRLVEGRLGNLADQRRTSHGPAHAVGAFKRP